MKYILIIIGLILPYGIHAQNVCCPDPLMTMFDGKNRSGFYSVGDFIYWRAEQDGMEYALSGLQTELFFFNVPAPDGKAFSPHFEWDPGFKVGIGYLNDCKEWDVFLNWTWYKTDADGSARAADTSAFNEQELWAQFGIARFTVSQLTAASAHWNLHYNTLDCAIARQFAIGSRFSLKPFIGLRGAWIHQKYDIENVGFGVGNFEHIRNTMNLNGVGFRGGSSSSWYFAKGFSFFSDVGVSLIYGHISGRYKEIRTVNLGAPVPVVANNQTVADVPNIDHTMKTGFEFALGFRYETQNCNRWNLAFDVAWEFLNWVSMNQFYVPVTGSDPFPTNFPSAGQNSGQFEHSDGDLGLMGLRVGAQFKY